VEGSPNPMPIPSAILSLSLYPPGEFEVAVAEGGRVNELDVKEVEVNVGLAELIDEDEAAAVVVAKAALQ